VLGLGALEWAVLAPAAWLSAVVLLATPTSLGCWRCCAGDCRRIAAALGYAQD
jgi:hypothetical protein